MKKAISNKQKNKPLKLLLIFLATLVLFGLQACKAISFFKKPYLSTATNIFAETFSPSSTQNKVKTTPSVTPIQINQEREQWLKGLPCSLPCWEGVTPGKTIYSEVFKIFQDNPLVKIETSGSDPRWGGKKAVTINFHINLSTAGYVGNVTSFGTDRAITIISIDNFYGLRLEDVTNVFGVPSHIVYSVMPPGENPNSPWALRLIWMDKGLVLFSHGKGIAPQIDNQLPINIIDFFVPGINGLRDGEFADASISEVNSLLKDWHGYGNYESYYPIITTTP